MPAAMTMWEQIEPLLIERMEATINHDPRVLLEVDGGPAGMKADVVLARLYGFDEQVDHTWRIREVLPDLRVPIPQRLNLASFSDESPIAPAFRVAEYVLQSNYATCRMAPEYAPPDAHPGPPDFMFSVLFVRYKRRR